MRILAGRLRYQPGPHTHTGPFRSAAGVARTWLPGWQPARAQRLALPSAMAAARWVSLGRVVQQEAPLLQALQARRLQVLPPLQGWRVWTPLGAWLRVQAHP